MYKIHFFVASVIKTKRQGGQVHFEKVGGNFVHFDILLNFPQFHLQRKQLCYSNLLTLFNEKPESQTISN